VAALAGCAVPVHGRASAAPRTAAAPSTAGTTRGTIPGGAEPTCLVGDTCDDDGGSPAPAGVVCAPLPAAMTAFDRLARAAYPGGQLPGGGPAAAPSPLTDLVLDVVDRCGFQVMVDVADQYPDPLWSWLRTTAVSALGEIGALPDGLRCADLAALGLGPKQSVDYWFL
jgi:hypothetical protein